MSGWLFANRFSAQSGYPLTIVETTAYQADGQYTEYWPDLVAGAPIYLHGSSAVYTNSSGQSVPAPGGWMLNRMAFACTTNGSTTGTCGTATPTRQGTLGRNYVRQPSFWVLNTATQRNFRIYERLQLIFRAEAFNILNHPNLDNPNTTLSSSTFGELTTGTTTIGSGNALYGMGAARSLQLSLKLQF